MFTETMTYEKEIWLGLIEACVLKALGTLEEADFRQISEICDLNHFYEQQAPEVKKAIDATVGVNGFGLEVLLSELEDYELV